MLSQPDALPEPDSACGLQGDGSQITVEPGLIGGEVNRILARHKAKHNHPIQYKIGPDPSSIDSCMVGGMVSNNSSGMCCGVSQNTYHTLKDMRVVFLDGTVLDTKDPKSREAFLEVRWLSADAKLSIVRIWPIVNCMHTAHSWYFCLASLTCFLQTFAIVKQMPYVCGIGYSKQINVDRGM